MASPASRPWTGDDGGGVVGADHDSGGELYMLRVFGDGLAGQATTSSAAATYHVPQYSSIRYDTDRTGHAPHGILRRTACVYRSRDTVPVHCVALFVLLLVTGFGVAM